MRAFNDDGSISRMRSEEPSEAEVIVPRVPTEKMRQAGGNALYPPSIDLADEVWRVMIAAAPEHVESSPPSQVTAPTGLRDIALAAMQRMRQAGESFEMCARWIAEDYAKATLPAASDLRKRDLQYAEQIVVATEEVRRIHANDPDDDRDFAAGIALIEAVRAIVAASRTEAKPDDAAIEALVKTIWLKEQPSHEAQRIRAALAAEFMPWPDDFVPRYVWDLVDIAASRGKAEQLEIANTVRTKYRSKTQTVLTDEQSYTLAGMTKICDALRNA